MKDYSNRLDFTSNPEVNRETVGRRITSSLSKPMIHLRERLQLPAIVPSTAIVAILSILLSISSSFAGSATWKTSPSTGNWNNASNWTPSTIPNGPSDTATFASSNTTGLSLSANTQVNGIVFNAGASAFAITASPTFTLTISGASITNNSGISQNFVALPGPAAVNFTGSATAGSQTVFTAIGGNASGGQFGGRISFFNDSNAGTGTFKTKGTTVSGGYNGLVSFSDTASAADGTFINNGGTVSGAAGGGTDFSGSSTAGNGTFTNKSRVVDGAFGGFIGFSLTSSAGNGTFTNEGNGKAIDSGADIRFSSAATAGNASFTNNGGAANGAIGGTVLFTYNANAGYATLINNGGSVTGAGGGSTVFTNHSNARSATLVANGGTGGGAGGTIQFRAASRGGTARVAVYGNGSLDISVPAHQAVDPKTIGSIEGNGLVFLGSNNLTVGGNNLNTVFSGTIQQGGGVDGGAGGSLTKIGSGYLVFRDGNTYTGINVNGGKVVINNTHAGFVQVSSGRLGGSGTIIYGVTIGGSDPGAILSPGAGAVTPGILTIQSELRFYANGTYNCWLNTKKVTANKVIANGVAIVDGAQFSFADVGGSALTPGTIFTLIDNTAAIPIAGTFSNLPDGSTFTSNGNSYAVDYQGGSGNDLTLTVVP